MSFAITVHGIYEFEMSELLKDKSDVICSGSDNSCMLLAQYVVEASQEWISGIVKKKSRSRATLQHTLATMN